jgi:hypothetical protein
MRKFILALALCMAIAPAAAAPAYCTGKILSVITYADGSVMILTDFRKDWTVICNLNSDYQGVTPLTCVSWLASATRAHAKPPSPSANIAVYYSDVASCAAVPTYRSAPAPVYFMFF